MKTMKTMNNRKVDRCLNIVNNLILFIMVQFSMNEILMYSGFFSFPIFLSYFISKSMKFTILLCLFIISYSVELYYQKFSTKIFHLIIVCVLLFIMLTYIYERYNASILNELIIIFSSLFIAIYYLISILKMDNNYTFNRGYLAFMTVSFLYFSSLPGVSDNI